MLIPQYKHFQIEHLASGVYAAVSSEDGGLLCNAGIVDLGGTTLVFDSGATLPAALELRAAAEALTGHSVGYVVNSHVHPEHVNGNVVFSEATVIASHVTRAAIAAEGHDWMEQMRQQLDGRLEGYPNPRDLVVPALSYAEDLIFHGSRQQARLIACGNAHSACDAVLWLPDSGILFTGDLITDGNLILCYGNPEAWLETLDRLEALRPAQIVPGHGNVAEADAAIQRGRRYITGLLDLVSHAPVVTPAADWLAELAVPEGCGEYWFRQNVRFLLSRR